jgi:hypothetical protein
MPHVNEKSVFEVSTVSAASPTKLISTISICAFDLKLTKKIIIKKKVKVC